MGKHDAEQWTLFKENTVGYWKGLQAGYDPQDDEVEDYMYTEVTVEGEDELTQRKGRSSSRQKQASLWPFTPRDRWRLARQRGHPPVLQSAAQLISPASAWSDYPPKPPDSSFASGLSPRLAPHPVPGR